MENYHIILVRHHSNNSRGNICVRVKSERFQQTIYIPYTNDPGEHVTPILEAKKYLENIGFKLIGQGELENDYVLISETFEPIK